MFWENFGGSIWTIKRDTADGVLVFDPGFPSDEPFPFISGQDCGIIAGIAFKNPEKYIGK